MTGTKICLASAMGFSVIDLASADLDKLGIVSILLIAIIAIWRDGKSRQDKLENIISENTKALTEVRDAVRRCHEKAGQ